MLYLEPIATGLTHWEEQARRFPDRTIFQTAAWMSFLQKTQGATPVVAWVRDGAEIVGCFTGLIVRKFGVRILGSPFPGWTTSYMGLSVLPGISRRAAVKALIEFAFENLHCIHFELMDRHLVVADLNGLGFEHRIVTGFEINLEEASEALFTKMSSACRRCMRKAEKSGVFIEEAHDPGFAEDYYAQLVDVFAKQLLVPSYGINRVRELVKSLESTGMLLLLRARDPQNRCVATGIFPAMNGTMYFWGGASWRAAQPLRPNELVQWYAINYWKERGIKRYDMGGGGEYKRKYGGAEIAIPWFRKSKYETIERLRNLGLKVVRTRQRISGGWQKAAFVPQ